MSFCQRPARNPRQACASHAEASGWAMAAMGFLSSSVRCNQSEEHAGMTRDHELLVSGNDPRGDFRFGPGNASTASHVGVGVELEAEPGRGFADAAAYLRRVLADTAGEDQGVDAAERGGERSDRLRGAVNE